MKMQMNLLKPGRPKPILKQKFQPAKPGKSNAFARWLEKRRQGRIEVAQAKAEAKTQIVSAKDQILTAKATVQQARARAKAARIQAITQAFQKQEDYRLERIQIRREEKIGKRKAEMEARVARVRAGAEAKAATLRNKASARATHLLAKTKSYKLKQEHKRQRMELKQKAKLTKAKAKILRMQGKARDDSGEKQSLAAFLATGSAMFFLLSSAVGALYFNNPWVWTLCLWLTVLSFRAHRFGKQGQFKWHSFYPMLLPRLTAIVVGSWLITFFSR